MRHLAAKFWIIPLLILSLLITACSSATAVPTQPPPPSPSNVPGPAVSQTSNASQTIRIYASLPLSGASKIVGQSLENAMRLALTDVTGGTGYISKLKIDFVPLDNGSANTTGPDPAQEAINANKAANDPETVLYLGPTSTATAQVAIPILNKANIAMISPGTTYPGLTKSIQSITKSDEPARYYPSGVRNYFRLLPTDELQGRADASYTEAKLQLHKVFVVEDGTDYGQGLAKAYELAATYYNLVLLGHSSLSANADNADKVSGDIKAANPEVVFFAGGSRPAARLVAKLRANGNKAAFLGGGGIQDDAFVQDAGPAAEGVYSSISGTDSSGFSPKGSAFLKAYRDKFGDTLQSSSIYGYDAMSAGLTALQQAGTKERGAVLKAVAGLKNFTGVSGRWRFDQNGDTSLTVFAFYINKNQKWVFDSIADTSSNSQKPSNPVAVSDNSTPTPAAPALTTPATSRTPKNGAITLAPSTPGPADKRVDAVSKLPPSLKLFKIANLPVTVYVPTTASSSREPLQVLVVLHGMFDNGGDFCLPLLDFAEKKNLVLIAPTFNYNVNYKNPEVIANEDVELTNQLTQVFRQLPNALGSPVQGKLLLFGFSRGAQLAHHFALFYPNQVLAAAVLSGGAYTLPQTQSQGEILNFPFGLANFNQVVHHEFDRESFRKISFEVQVGALDNDPAQVGRSYDKYIGNNRVARGQSFYQSLLELGVNAQFKIVPNTSHEVNAAQVSLAEQFFQNFLPG